ncbi:hypothetical protein JRO89_XS07G0078200 [Xanthoceras sorbifolium]|uniref:Uncharacterized protein n=1 Tax=Xanthoceras sorbifolium TaxID=99658 RepID=A0ABQ8HT19_9ROSI|nr:hypothetical protein JRO89_XS07G0078200 [Xanthoceras sorbifolium]
MRQQTMYYGNAIDSCGDPALSLLSLMCCVVWIFCFRNQVIHDFKVLLGEDYWEKAGVFLADFVQACEASKAVPLSSSAR